MKIIAVEDEKDLAESIFTYFNNEGNICEVVNSYEDARAKLNIYEYDCALIDIMLPDGNGLDLIREIKEKQPNCGIILISAKSSLDDKIKGLDFGSDDYLTKPFYMSELNSRVKSVLRRRFYDGNKSVNFGEIKIFPEEKKAFVNDKEISLTKKEFDILVYLISNTKRVLTKESIAEHIWGDFADSFDKFDFVYTHVKNLRKKLSEAGCKDYIKSVYGSGYKLSAE
jgi:DNA-binding response OmpR family regulator